MQFEMAKLIKYTSIDLSGQTKDWNQYIRNIKQQKILIISKKVDLNKGFEETRSPGLKNPAASCGECARCCGSIDILS
jgi:hypothetical protein